MPREIIMDCEVLQMIQRYMEPEITGTSPKDIALDAIKEVGPNGHYFGIEHTQERYETAFYQPFVSDWRNFEAWEIAGGTWTAERAHQTFKDIINNFEEPALSDDIKAELQAFVAKRKEEGGAPTDY